MASVADEQKKSDGGGAKLRLPTGRDIFFSCKTFLAAAIGLVIGFRFQLENPYWSALTCYVISSPPGAGAIRSKSLFRLAGTVIGACVALLLAACFADQIGVLAVAYIMAISITGYLFYSDRTPMNYVYLAICVTIGVVGLVRLQSPLDVFSIATARTAEICIGITVMFIVDSIFKPEAQTPKFVEDVDEWRRTARDWLIDVAQADAGGAPDDEKREQARDRLKTLIKGLSTIDERAVQLPFDTPARPPRGYHLDLLRHEVTALTGDIAGLELWSRGFDEASCPAHAVVRAEGEAVAAWLRTAPDDPCDTLDTHVAEGEALIERIAHARRTIDPQGSRDEIVARGLLARLASAVRHWCDLALAVRAVATGQPQSSRLEAIGRDAKPVRSVDHLANAIDIIPMILATTFMLTFWYLTAWSAALGALMMAFIGTLFLAGLPVVKGVVGLLIGFVVAGCFVFVYQFALLPRATSIEMLLLALACGLIPLGMLMAQNPLGLIASAASIAFLALGNAYQADVVQTISTLLSVMAGVCVAGVALYLCSYDRERFTARRLAAAARRDNRDLARSRRLPRRDRFTSLALYRLSLYVPAAEKVHADTPLRAHALLRELSIGANLLSLRRLEPAATELAGNVIRTIRDVVAQERDDRSSENDGDDALRVVLARSIDDPAIVDDPVGADLREALVGLDLSLRGSTTATDTEHLR